MNYVKVHRRCDIIRVVCYNMGCIEVTWKNMTIKREKLTLKHAKSCICEDRLTRSKDRYAINEHNLNTIWIKYKLMMGLNILNCYKRSCPTQIWNFAELRVQVLIMRRSCINSRCRMSSEYY